MPDRFYFGVDGGQSSTTALLANDRGEVLGRGLGGPCNHASAEAGRRKFLSAVSDCLHEACREAELPAESIQFSGVCFGLSGGAEDKTTYIHELIRSKQYKITHDGEIALTGATAGAPGIIIIAGTGSFAFGKNACGRTARSGGWGYIYGDEGGAFDLTRQALRAALRHEEGWGHETQLTAMLLDATGATSANQLLHQFYADVPRSIVATYAPLVTRASEAGDVVATMILEKAARELCRYVEGVHRNLFTISERPRISFIGGVFQSNTLLHQFKSQTSQALGIVAEPPIYLPVVGALLEAFKLDNVEPELTSLGEIGIVS